MSRTSGERKVLWQTSNYVFHAKYAATTRLHGKVQFLYYWLFPLFKDKPKILTLIWNLLDCDFGNKL